MWVILPMQNFGNYKICNETILKFKEYTTFYFNVKNKCVVVSKTQDYNTRRILVPTKTRTTMKQPQNYIAHWTKASVHNSYWNGHFWKTSIMEYGMDVFFIFIWKNMTLYLTFFIINHFGIVTTHLLHVLTSCGFLVFVGIFSLSNVVISYGNNHWTALSNSPDKVFTRTNLITPSLSRITSITWASGQLNLLHILLLQQNNISHSQLSTFSSVN